MSKVILIIALSACLGAPAAGQRRQPIKDDAWVAAPAAICPIVRKGIECEEGLLSDSPLARHQDRVGDSLRRVEATQLKRPTTHTSETVHGLVGLGIGAAAGYAIGAMIGGLGELRCLARCTDNQKGSTHSYKYVGAAFGGVAGLVIGLSW